MSYLIVVVSAAFVAMLTLFAGFGLGTLLLPVFALFFPIQIAVAVTAVVHFLNGLFVFWLMGKHARWKTVLLFGAPAAVCAVAGAMLLNWLAVQRPWLTWHLFGRAFEVFPAYLIIGVVMFVFALFDLVPRLRTFTIDPKYLPLGGALSGFFGGLSGHQGALRSTFLIKTGLPKESFIATGVVISLFVDGVRLATYLSSADFRARVFDGRGLLAAASLAAFLGAWIGSRLLRKTTLAFVRGVVGTLLLLIAIALAAGLLTR